VNKLSLAMAKKFCKFCLFWFRQRATKFATLNLRFIPSYASHKHTNFFYIISIFVKEVYVQDIEQKAAKIMAKQMYIEYKPKVSRHIEKIYFGPKVTEMELFQDMLVSEGLNNIPCEKSTNRLA
jgi:hypothetical protein